MTALSDLFDKAGEGDGDASGVLQLLLISTFNGLRELVVSLAARGHLSAETVERIYNSMAPALDDEDLRDDSMLVALRHALDGSFSAARFAALHAPTEDRDS